MPQLDGKIIMITGASTGIGRSIARVFAAEGATLVVAARNRNKLESAAQKLRALGAIILAVPTDVTKEDEVLALFEHTIKEFGRLDVLINNAGIFDGAPLDELPLGTWQKVIEVNLTGAFLCTREAMKIMKRQLAGRIINIGSISAQMPKINSAPYVTAKHGLVGLTKATALEGRAFGVAASCLHPGNVMTESDVETVPPEEPMMAGDDVAALALTMVSLPPNVNMLEAIILPITQPYLGRG